MILNLGFVWKATPESPRNILDLRTVFSSSILLNRLNRLSWAGRCAWQIQGIVLNFSHFLLYSSIYLYVCTLTTCTFDLHHWLPHWLYHFYSRIINNDHSKRGKRKIINRIQLKSFVNWPIMKIKSLMLLLLFSYMSLLCCLFLNEALLYPI